MLTEATSQQNCTKKNLFKFGCLFATQSLAIVTQQPFEALFTQSQAPHYVGTPPKEDSQKTVIFGYSLDLPQDSLPVRRI